MGLIVMKAGDVNGDGQVNLLDLTELASAYDSKQGDGNYDPACDFNGAGRIDLLNLSLLATYYTVSID
ncbi:MAG TPA: dockerin type I domain-containing protein [bacterium]|nr:dockerin type I domain-containing protein [bacterium]